MYGFFAVGFGLGNRYSEPGVSAICAANASRAKVVIGMSPIPFRVLESGICTTPFSKST